MKFSHSILPLVSVLALVACETAVPHQFPTGYTYNQSAYKSPLPAQTVKVTKAQRQHMGPVQAEQYRKSLYDLVTKLTDRAGIPPKPVYVLPHDPMTPFFAQVDNDLREALRHQGYTLAPSVDGAYAFTYDAALLEKPKLEGEEYKDAVDTGGNNVEIVLTVLTGLEKEATVLTEERGHFFIQGAETHFGAQAAITDFVTYTVRED